MDWIGLDWIQSLMSTLLGRARQGQLGRRHLGATHPAPSVSDAGGEAGLAQAHDHQGGEHVARAGEEVGEGGDVDAEEARGVGGGVVRAADYGEGGGGGVWGKADRGDDDVWDGVGGVEGGDCGDEGGGGRDGDAGESSVVCARGVRVSFG